MKKSHVLKTSAERRNSEHPYRMISVLFLFMLFCAAVAPVSGQQDYRIQLGDVLQVSFLGIEEEKEPREIVVRADGMIFLPWIGVVQAEGLSYHELSENIKQKLSKYFRNFEVVAGPADVKPKFSILGKVVSPGTFPLSQGMTLTEAIGIAGGLTPGASTSMKVIRMNKDVLTADLDKILKQNDLTQNLTIRPGDVIYVSEKLGNKVIILGSVKNPGEYDLQPGWGVSEAMVIAGGLASSATVMAGVVGIVYAQRQGFYLVKVRRGGKDIYDDYIDPNTMESRYANKEKFVLDHGDIIFVREMRYSVIVIGAVKNPYIYEFKEGDRVTDAIALAGGMFEGSVGGSADLKNVGVVRVSPDGKSIIIKINLEDVLRKGDSTQNVELVDRDIVYVPQKHRKFKWDEFILKISNIKTIREIIKTW